MNAALNKILNNCNIYFNDALISKETILRAYYAFFIILPFSIFGDVFRKFSCQVGERLFFAGGCGRIEEQVTSKG